MARRTRDQHDDDDVSRHRRRVPPPPPPPRPPRRRAVSDRKPGRGTAPSRGAARWRRKWRENPPTFPPRFPTPPPPPPPPPPARAGHHRTTTTTTSSSSVFTPASASASPPAHHPATHPLPSARAQRDRPARLRIWGERARENKQGAPPHGPRRGIGGKSWGEEAADAGAPVPRPPPCRHGALNPPPPPPPSRSLRLRLHPPPHPPSRFKRVPSLPSPASFAAAAALSRFLAPVPFSIAAPRLGSARRRSPPAESMARPLALALALLLAVSVTVLPLASSADDHAHCERAVKGWADSAGEGDNGGDKLNLKDLLFFLHIPRTGGRTYFHCFLKKLYTNAQECPRSYDKLRFDPSHPDCTLVVSHDDYSLTSKLPRERTSVVTILRNPVDRVFSTYEFSVEVAARFLVHPNLTSAKTMTSRVLTKSRAVSTLDIWPWKYLVPWMREDLFARRDARGSENMQSSKKINAYDVEDMVMPLHQYINDPVAHEIIHNGATFQITGLTNNSYFDGAHEVRHCVRKHPDLGRFVLQVAKNRLDRMLYVGLTEDHEESARLFAHMVGAQVLSQSGALKLDVQEDQPSGTDSHSSMLDPEEEETNEHMNSTHGWKNNEALNTTEDDHGKGNMTVGKLMETYEGCIAKLRKSQSSRRKISLKKVAEANFTKAARRQVPEAILNQIISLNSLDMELYEHAKNIFKQEHLMLKGQHPMVVKQKQSTDEMVWSSSSYKGQHPIVVQQKQLTDQKDWIDKVCESWSCSTWWKVASFGLGIAVTTVFVVFVVTGRRTLKLKV